MECAISASWIAMDWRFLSGNDQGALEFSFRVSPNTTIFFNTDRDRSLLGAGGHILLVVRRKDHQ